MSTGTADPSFLDSLDAPDGEGHDNNNNGAGAAGSGASDTGDGDAGEGAGAPGASVKGAGAGGAAADADPAAGRAAGKTGEAAGAAAAGDRQQQGVVPQAALAEAREQNRQLKAKIEELEKLPRLTAEDAELLKDLRAARAAKETQAAQVPDFVQDPKGHVDARLAEVVKKLETTDQRFQTLEQQQAAERQQAQQREQLNTLLTTVSTAEAEFTKANPDYQDALDHARSVRAQQLRIMAPEATDAQITKQVTLEELQLAAQALKQGRNPAQVAYALAGHFGYTKKAAAADAGDAGAGAGAGAAAGAAAAALDGNDRSAVRTMGGGGLADDNAGNEPGSTTPELGEAFAEVFGRR